MKKENGTVLEVGVGTSRFFREALKSGVDVYDIDVYPSKLNILKTSLEKEE